MPASYLEGEPAVAVEPSHIHLSEEPLHVHVPVEHAHIAAIAPTVPFAPLAPALSPVSSIPSAPAVGYHTKQAMPRQHRWLLEVATYMVGE
ncbi:unnamed protein product [Strongylus vulgaris]|uniref:Uncharacterized protein n=1 Tax=Strongylus vulgaris TaxID=40348 RepID=A0A3P7JXS5_STRVU|nr:unnamed protein product [Strongylus vulgaris]